MYNPHLVYDNIDLTGEWTLEFNLKVKPGRVVGSSSYDEYFMAIGTGQYFRLDTEARPHLHCTWLGTMGDPITGVSGPLTPGIGYAFALVNKGNGEWYFYVNGILKTQGTSSSEGSGG